MIRGRIRYRLGQSINVRMSVLTVMLVLLIWVVLTEGRIIKPLYLPSPSEVAGAAGGIGAKLLLHVGATLARVVSGFSLGTLVGISLGLLMCYSDYLFAALHPLVESWRPVPPVALIPFFILWFGFSDWGKIILVSFGSMLILIVHTVEAVRNVRPIYIRAAYTLGADRKQVFRGVIVPAILPHLTSGLRIALALSVSLVIVSEFMGAQSGLGYLINISKVTFSTQTILLAVIVIGVLSSMLDWGLRRGMGRLTRWAEKAYEALA